MIIGIMTPYLMNLQWIIELFVEDDNGELVFSPKNLYVNRINRIYIVTNAEQMKKV